MLRKQSIHSCLLNRRHDQHKSSKKSFENVVKFRYLGMSTNIQSRIFSHFISKNIKIKVYGNVICLLLYMGMKLGLHIG
jgi:hypothetical protein